VKNPIATIAALAASGLGGAADVVRRAAGDTLQAVADPRAAEREKHRRARTFVAADDMTYPVGPCGFVPRSAKFDPARRGNPRSLRRWRQGRG
jgi:hypothetical protein